MFINLLFISLVFIRNDSTRSYTHTLNYSLICRIRFLILQARQTSIQVLTSSQCSETIISGLCNYIRTLSQTFDFLEKIKRFLQVYLKLIILSQPNLKRIRRLRSFLRFHLLQRHISFRNLNLIRIFSRWNHIYRLPAQKHIRLSKWILFTEQSICKSKISRALPAEIWKIVVSSLSRFGLALKGLRSFSVDLADNFIVCHIVID